LTNETKKADFFLPDLCEAQSILFLVLISELLVFVEVLFSSNLFQFNWLELGLTSLFVQWLVLGSAALLCNIRPWLMRMAVVKATVVAYGLILLLTFLFSVIAEIVMDGFVGISKEGWGAVARNMVIAVIMTGIAFRYFFLAHQLRIQEKAELTSRIQALQSRIRPHFLFNSMNIIASLISVDPDLAEEVVEDLSMLFRASLNEATSEPVRLSEEVSLCEKYVHIESLRLDKRLQMAWQVDVDTNRVKIPLLTLQPLLENAIYHGVQPLPEGGLVTVGIRETGDNIEIVVTNPLGGAADTHDSGNRMALDNIRNRMIAVYGQGASLTTVAEDKIFTTRLVYPRSS
jgi:two-component system sensor histidine kinase AlgZ